MEDMMKRTICALVTVALGCLITPRTALAVDGQVAITQARAMAGGVTPGDAPGFPVSINLPGSYILSSGLTVPDANTTAIEINADHVTVDLNGFTILGPTDCSGGLDPCANAGVGAGIITPDVRFNITIRRGTIQGMGSEGVRLNGDSHRVEYMNLRSNGTDAVVVLSGADNGGSVVEHNTVQRNGGFGIRLDAGIVADNTVNTNRRSGITVGGGLVLHNLVSHNPIGVALAAHATYVGNVMFDNTVLEVVGGLNGGQNLCGTVTCPGAQF
jgi:hypothetical protein